MSFLKVVVILMGALVVCGTGVLAWGLAQGWNRHEDAAASPAATSTVSNDPAYAVTDVPPPEGMHFEQMSTTANKVLLRFSGPQGERILVVDPRTGQVTGTIAVPAAGK